MIDGIGEAIAAAWWSAMAVAFGAGWFCGWLVFWALPTAWPSIKQWIHAVSA